MSKLKVFLKLNFYSFPCTVSRKDLFLSCISVIVKVFLYKGCGTCCIINIYVNPSFLYKLIFFIELVDKMALIRLLVPTGLTRGKTGLQSNINCFLK